MHTNKINSLKASNLIINEGSKAILVVAMVIKYIGTVLHALTTTTDVKAYLNLTRQLLGFPVTSHTSPLEYR